MAQGQVSFTSPNTALIVVQHDDGFAVVELLGSEGLFDVGDAVSGDWSALGGEPIYKDGEKHDAYFQGNFGSLDQAVSIASNAGKG